MSQYKDLIAEAKAAQLFDEDKDLHKRLIEALESAEAALTKYRVALNGLICDLNGCEDPVCRRARTALEGE